MARNSENSQSMLFRFREAQAADLGILDTNRTRRPKAISTQEHIPTCERWRGQVLKEISRKVSKIQDPALSDFQIRDVNDELNRLFREKWQWEMRIRELGGPNYMRGGGRVTDDEGRVIEGGGKGYRYFGRAKELPGVKELFEAATRPKASVMARAVANETGSRFRTSRHENAQDHRSAERNAGSIRTVTPAPKSARRRHWAAAWVPVTIPAIPANTAPKRMPGTTATAHLTPR